MNAHTMFHDNDMGAGLGLFGVFHGSGATSEGRSRRELAMQLEELGFGTMWIGSANGDLALADELLRSTTRLCVATGIVNVWQFEAADVAANHRRVTDAHPGRFVLGLGVGHAGFAPNYDRPLAKLESYLDELDTADDPVPAGHRVIAALGPRALRIAATRARGTCPYLVPPEHTADARTQLGQGPLLAPEQKIVLEPDADEARRIARDALAIYLTLPNYVNNLRRYGLTDDDFADGGSDRLVDAVVAWGDDGAIHARLQAHLDAGADHVAVQLLGKPSSEPAERSAARWQRVADLLPER